MLILQDGAPIIQTINGRRYVFCDTTLTRKPDDTYDGPPTHCGALIDVTDGRGIKATDDCGASHRREDNAILGVD